MYDEVLVIPSAQSTQLSDNENRYDDIVYKSEEEPPPIPPKKRQTIIQNVMTDYMRDNSSEDEEGYVSVTAPTQKNSTPPDTRASMLPQDSQDSATSLSTLCDTFETPVFPIITCSQNSSDGEEESLRVLISDDTMDAVEHSKLLGSTQDHISLGNLSSLEITSPQVHRNILPGVEQYFNFLKLHSDDQRLSPVPDDGSEHDIDHDDKFESGDEENVHLRPPMMSTPHSSTTSLDTNSNASAAITIPTSMQSNPTYDKLQHEYWRQQSESRGSSNTTHCSPSKQFVTVEKPRQQHFPQNQQPPISFFSPDETFFHPLNSSSPAEFCPQARDPVQIQTYLLQKMQQALEAVQAAYAYMPYMSPETEYPTSKQHNSSSKMATAQQSKNGRLPEESSQVPVISVASSEGKVAKPHVLMKQCFGKYT